MTLQSATLGSVTSSADVGKIYNLSNATATTMTIGVSPVTGVLPIGSQILVIQAGAGIVTITPGTTTYTYASGGAPAATSVVVTVAPTTIGAGAVLTGTGFAANTKVTSVASTTINFSPAASTQISGTITVSTSITGTPGLKTRAQYSVASIVQISQDVWAASGDLTV